MSTLRTFIAIELDEGLKENVARLQDQLQMKMPPRSVRWVRPEGIHLTLKFLGDTTTHQVDQVKEALARVAAGARPITFGVGGVGCFPHTRRPRVVWVGLHEPAGHLACLRDAVEAHVAPLGFPTEKRPFSPHLTLGRVHRRASNADVRQVGEVVAASGIGDIGEMTATGVSYIQSKLTPGGAVYTTLAHLELAEE